MADRVIEMSLCSFPVSYEPGRSLHPMADESSPMPASNHGTEQELDIDRGHGMGCYRSIWLVLVAEAAVALGVACIWSLLR